MCKYANTVSILCSIQLLYESLGITVDMSTVELREGVHACMGDLRAADNVAGFWKYVLT